MRQFLKSSIAIFAIFSIQAQVVLTEVLPAPVEPPPFELLSPTTNELCYDVDMSPYAGGEDLLFGTKLFEKGLTYLESKTPMVYSTSMAARTWRLCEAFLIYLPLNCFTSVVQHEVFGHGFRIRDFGGHYFSVSGYDFHLPPPYGDGGACTSFKCNPGTVSSTMFTSISMAGIEAQQILANETKLKWLESRKVDPRQAVLYLVSQYALNLYSSHEKLQVGDLEGHDIADYARFLNFTYTESELNVSNMRNLSWINLADPYTYYSIFAWFRYLSVGKETSIPMIPIKGYGYLFGARQGLTPFGPEYFMDNYLVKGKNPIYFYLKGGSHAGNDYYGCGYFAPKLWIYGKWAVGTRFDTWWQPKLLLKPGSVPLYDLDFRAPPQSQPQLYSDSSQHSHRLGCAFSSLVSYTVGPALGFQAEFGGKSEGFLPGYSLYESPVFRVSYLASF